MGNCMRRQRSSSMSWDGDDWDLYDGRDGLSPYHEKGAGREEERGLLGEGMQGGPSGAGTEVKIKITKKQLEELLGRADIEGMTTEQLLMQLVKVNGEFQVRHRPWRPVLQSIPEVN